MDQTLTNVSIDGWNGSLDDCAPLASSTAMKGWLGVIIIGISMLLSGCGGLLLVGAGVGAGAFSYIAGNVIKVYEAEYQESIAASTTVMKQLVFKGKEESEDGLKTVIEGYHDYDTPVTIEVAFVDPGSTQIGVRTGYIGNDNLEISEQLHANIAKELTRSAPPSLQATSLKKKVSEPRTLQVTSQKEKVQPEENQLRTSRTLYDDLPPPPKSVSASTAGKLDDIPSIDDEQEIQTLSQSENEQEIIDQIQTKAIENKDDTESPMSEMSAVPVDSVSTSTAGEPNSILSIDSGQEPQIPSQSENEQNKVEQLQARATQKEGDYEPLISEPVAAPLEINPEKTGEMQALLIPESKEKTFTYYPESKQTIHSGSYSVLDEVIAYLDTEPSKRVDIRAYMNSSGNRDTDLALTNKRIFEIRNYLILNGISAERISAQGLGDNNFPVINSPDHQGALKRPVEMIIK